MHPSSTAACRRDPSPDGTAEGQYTWFDHTTTYTYCGCGGPTTVANALGQVTTYRYDQAGNLTNVIYAVSPQLRYQYDAANRLTNMIDGVGTTRYTYTAAGNLLTEDSPWASDIVTYAYHASVPGLRTGLTLQQPSGSWSPTYDHIGQLRTAVGTGGQSTENLDGQERTSANTPTVSCARGQVLSGTFEGAGGIGLLWLHVLRADIRAGQGRRDWIGSACDMKAASPPPRCIVIAGPNGAGKTPVRARVGEF